MIHTAKFYVELKEDEVNYLSVKFRERITLLPTIIDVKFEGITTTFTKRFSTWWMFVNIDFIKMISKSDIVESDINAVRQKINQYLTYIFGKNSKEMTLVRIDFRFDAVIPNEQHRSLLLKMYKKTADHYGFKIKNDHYKTTVYFNSKSIKVIVYDKEAERDAKGIDAEDYEKEVLRFEVCLQNRHLNYMKKVYGLDKRIENYMTSHFWMKYMTKSICPIFFRGDYYPIGRIVKRLEEGKLDTTEVMKIKEFLCDISRLGFEGIKKMEKETSTAKIKPKYSQYMIDKYIAILESFNINPIPIPKHQAEKLGQNKVITNPFNIQLI